MIKMNRESFIKAMNKRYDFNGEFDFSGLVYKSSKLTVKCNSCGKENTKSALRHVSCTCKDCYSNMSQKKTKEEFIEMVDKKFGVGVYKFDKLHYINATKEIEIYCTKHNGYFKTTHFNIMRSAHGCNICVPNRKLTQSDVEYRCKTIYPYLDFDKRDEDGNNITTYTNSTSTISVWCNRHGGVWEVYANTLLRGIAHCGVCFGKLLRSTEEFTEMATHIHKGKYDYSLVNYTGSKEYVSIKCNECHNVFSQQPYAHMTGRGCPSCGKYGYQQNKPGYFYIQKLTSISDENDVIYKIGITGDLIRRIDEQSRHSNYIHEFIRTEYFEDGHKPRELETEVKRSIQCGMITEAELSDGFSETISTEDVYEVHKIVNKFIERI